MSKTVTIPVSEKPWFAVTINETTYKYPSGTTQTVPDEVAEAIEQIEASIPQESGKNAPLVPSPSIADAGKAVVVGEDGRYELGEGGGGGSEPAILTIANDKHGLICNNPNADMFNLEEVYEEGITVYIPLYIGGKVVYKNQDVNEALSLLDLYYLDNGLEVPYSGIKNFAVFEELNIIAGATLQAVDSNLLLPSSQEYYLILDLDTGRVIYAHESD